MNPTDGTKNKESAPHCYKDLDARTDKFWSLARRVLCTVHGHHQDGVDQDYAAASFSSVLHMACSD
jgi:hypothetical protein